MTSQGARQVSFRAIGGTTLDYNGDMRAGCVTELVAAEALTEEQCAALDANGLLLAWLRLRLDVENGDLPGLMQAFAEAEGAYNWSSLGSFGPIE